MTCQVQYISIHKPVMKAYAQRIVLFLSKFLDYSGSAKQFQLKYERQYGYRVMLKYNYSFSVFQEFLKKKQANANGTIPSPSFSVRNW